jgi:AcrR family transcriptional regulator
MAQRSTAEASPWIPFEDRRRARDAKREAVLRTAVQLFLDQGYHRATLDEVARLLNITKPALYNYFRSKEEILFECFSLGQELIDNRIAQINAEAETGLIKLQKLIRGCVAVNTSEFGMCLMRLDDREFSSERRSLVRAGKKRVDSAFRLYIAEGIADGTIMPGDPKLAALAVAGSVSWISFWFQSSGTFSRETIADAMVKLLTEGLAARRKPGARSK